MDTITSKIFLDQVGHCQFASLEGLGFVEGLVWKLTSPRNMFAAGYNV
jgi:hypothetical protein